MPKIRRKHNIPAGNLNLEEKLVHINRVAKVVKGGRRFSFNAIVVVGNGEGVVGHGLGKSNEVSDGIQKGFDNGRKNLINIPLTTTGSIHHPGVGKAGVGEVLLRAGCDGTGVLAGAAVKAILDVPGVQNMLSKSVGTSKPRNM